MRNLILLAILTFILNATVACSGGGESPASGTNGTGLIPDTPADNSTFTVTVSHGRNYDCFALNRSGSGELFCKGSNSNMELNTSSYIRYVATGNPLTAVKAFDDSFCYETSVATRPQSRTSGTAIYCHGEASLRGGVYNIFPLVYSGPNYTTASNGSADITHYSTPFTGGDMTLDRYVNQTDTAQTIYTDGTSLVTTTQHSCSIQSNVLDCGTFTVSVE